MPYKYIGEVEHWRRVDVVSSLPKEERKRHPFYKSYRNEIIYDITTATLFLGPLFVGGVLQFISSPNKMKCLENLTSLFVN